jgi:ZIP family zinc transporter
MGLLVTFILGIFIFVGILIIKLTKNSKVVEELSISIALGTMSSLMILDLIPEIINTFNKNNFILVIIFIFIGIIILKLLDIFIPEHDHEHSLSHNCSQENIVHIGIVSTLAIVLHNIIEGMAIYSIVNEDLRVGMLVALGVGLHNIPMGMIIYSTLEKEKKSKKILLLTISILSTFIGGLLMNFINTLLSDFVIGLLICITLGMLIYITLFELVPHILHSKNKKLSFTGIIIGIVIILISSLIE